MTREDSARRHLRGVAPNEFFLPNFCAVRPIFLLSVVAQLLAFVLILATGDVLTESWDELGLLSFFVQWIALMSAIALCLLRPVLAKLPVFWGAAASYILILFITGGFAAVAQHFMVTFNYQWSASPLTLQDFVIRCLLISAIIAFVALRYFYMQQQWKWQVKLESEARIEALQARIRPHFLFNSMNIIASLIHSKPRDAERAVEDLSALFRATLKDSGSLILVAQEWELCESYLRIEALRLGDRLKVEVDLSALPEDAVIPMLTLQPLIENAIYHGIQPLSTGGTVTVSGKRLENNNALEIRIQNPIPRDQRHSKTPGNRVAMANIQNRLQLLFGHSASIVVNLSSTVYEVVLVFPYLKY